MYYLVEWSGCYGCLSRLKGGKGERGVYADMDSRMP